MKKVILAFAFIFGLIMVGQATVEASQDQLIIINKATNKLAFFEKGKLVRTFPVATGKTTALTPEGRFPIVNKIKNRPYYTNNIPGGDPRNPLGDRWLGLNARGTYGTTYAIHGNNNASSVGNYVSAGCVRMHNSDIHWLFDQVKVNTDVVIVNSSKTFEQIAEANGYKPLPPIKVLVDGKELSVPSAPVMENNRVLVPMRSIFNALGASVQWNASTRTVTATANGKNIQLTIDSKRAYINGELYLLDVAPTIKSGHTLVPTRFVSEALGAQVKWDGKKRTVSLLSSLPAKPKPEEPPKPVGPVRTKIDVIVNGNEVAGEGFILDGISMVPMRSIFEWLNVPFTYDASTAEVTATLNGRSIVIRAGEKEAHINGAPTELQAAPVIEGGRLYVPARAITETFSGSIKWENRKLYIDGVIW